MNLQFSKMHGVGNDFVVLDLRDDEPLTRRLSGDASGFCRAMADRHVGVGCDQVLTIEAPRSVDAIAGYRIWNADGSHAQQCGNGARCVAAWLVRDGATSASTFQLDSPADTHAVTRLPVGQYAIAMGVPQFAPQSVPLAGWQQSQDEYTLEVVVPQAGIDKTRSVRFGAVSMGNPHALIQVDAVAQAPVALLGDAFQQHPSFPDSVNVGFAEVVTRDCIRLRVYERGAGETLACGSGACAAAAILMRRGRIDRAVRVVLPGGELNIAWPSDTVAISMAGPATFVFEGELTL